MERLANVIDRVNAAIGKATIWLLLASVLVGAGNALARKFLSLGSNAFLELQWYLIGAMIMLGASWTVQDDAHVRIEIVAMRFPARIRNWIEVCGHAFMLLPFSGAMALLSWPFFTRSWAQNEGSLSYGGLLVWPMRGLIVLGFALLFLQGLSVLFRAIRRQPE